MASGTFWEVLADRIRDEGRPAETAASPRRWPVTQTWDPGLRFVLLNHPAAPAPVGAGEPAPVIRDRPRGADGRAGHPSRLLTAAQRSAFDVLRASGASGLNEDFTAADLRSAYRRLALRWHPDRHATAAPAERALLAQTFARITSAYRQLAGRPAVQ